MKKTTTGVLKRAGRLLLYLLLALLVITALWVFSQSRLILRERQECQLTGAAEAPSEQAIIMQTEQTEPDQQNEYASSNSAEMTDRVEALLNSMTLEEKAAQVIITTPEGLTGYGQVTAAGEASHEAINTHPVGGLIYFESNLINPSQTVDMIQTLQQYSRERIRLPLFICVDEEGGSVTRIAQNDNFDVTDVGDMYYLGLTGDAAQAREAGAYIGSYLTELGINVNFAPVADVLTNPDNPVIRTRSFGSSAIMDASMTAAFVEGAGSSGIISCLKHFPGHGDTGTDSHTGAATTYRTLEEMRQCEWIPFLAGIEAGCPMVMVGHIDTPALTDDGLPSSLSTAVITDMLKGELGFEGLVVTDALNMGAITNRYSSYQAARMAINAGADILLMPTDLSGAIAGIVDGVNEGTIPAERLDDAVRKIVTLKLQL